MSASPAQMGRLRPQQGAVQEAPQISPRNRTGNQSPATPSLLGTADNPDAADTPFHGDCITCLSHSLVLVTGTSTFAMDRARARHLLPCSPVGPQLSLAMREGHLHQLQLWALFHSLLAAHGPATRQQHFLQLSRRLWTQPCLNMQVYAYACICSTALRKANVGRINGDLEEASSI